MEIQIRPYHEQDLRQVEALDSRVKPYRTEDQPEVEAMFQRAKQACEAGDDLWLPPEPPSVESEAATDNPLASWVAVTSSNHAKEQVVGIVEVYRAVANSKMPQNMPWVQEWLKRNDVAELRHLRVAPELSRQGIGTRLTRTVIEWCANHGFGILFLDTTSAQIPALNLYRKLGFREVGRSFYDKYELVWHELRL